MNEIFKKRIVKTSIFTNISPNPFSLSATITYNLQEAAPVKISVINSAGMEVMTILEQEQVLASVRRSSSHWVERYGLRAKRAMVARSFSRYLMVRSSIQVIHRVQKPSMLMDWWSGNDEP